MGVIIRLLRGEERFDYKSDWFELHDAALQILPLQEDMPMATASSLSPSGMQIAGKYGCGVLSIASTSAEGLAALPTQWAFAEEAAAKHGSVVDRRDWRVLMSWHLAETREQAREEAVLGLQKWHNEYNVRVLGRPGAERVEDAVGADGSARRGGHQRRFGGGRHARRPDRGDPQPAGGHRWVRRRPRLRPRLGEHRGDAPLVGPRRPLRRAGGHRCATPAAGFGRLRRGQQVGPRWPARPAP